MEFLEGDIFEGEGTRLHDATNIVFLHIERQDFYELQNFHVEVMVVHFEMPRADIYSTSYDISVEIEELLQDEESVFEIGVGHLQPQLDEHVVVLVIDDAEAVAFEHLPICHAAIAQINLGALRESVLTSLHLKLVVRWHVVNDLVPDSFSHIFAHFHLFFARSTASDLAHFCESAWLRAHPLISKSFLFYKKVQIVITFKTR